VSIADNPQETFGLTLLEAQAAGLPVIASDYDGYRDLVAHGATGLLVPTLGPEPAQEEDFVDQLAPLLFDNQYHLLLAQRTAVDAPALAEALRTLLTDLGLRTRMGAAGRGRIAAASSGRRWWPGTLSSGTNWPPFPARTSRPCATCRTRCTCPTPRSSPATPRARQARHGSRPGARPGPARRQRHPMLYAGLDSVLDPDIIRNRFWRATATQPRASRCVCSNSVGLQDRAAYPPLGRKRPADCPGGHMSKAILHHAALRHRAARAWPGCSRPAVAERLDARFL
jgi:hypothetical protein